MTMMAPSPSSVRSDLSKALACLRMKVISFREPVRARVTVRHGDGLVTLREIGAAPSPVPEREIRVCC